MQRTNIEYLTHSWNPICMRCTPVSESCKHCWHLALCNRLSANPKISTIRRNAYAGLVGPQLIQGELEAPLKRKKPAIIGVQFMGDLFHESVTENQWIQVFDIIRKSIYNGGGRGHKFLILTKRPHTMKLVMERLNWNGDRLTFNKGTPFINLSGDSIYLGVTAENQQMADERIPILLQIPVAKRFVSIEPMLGPVDLHLSNTQSDVIWRRTHGGNYQREFIDWVIAGCESGSGRRPAKIEWFRGLAKQCIDNAVSFFLKQMATEAPAMAGCETGLPMYYENFKSKVIKMPELDGKIWNERP